MTLPTDEELVARCKVELPGNTRSYEMLVQRYMSRVFSITYRVVGNKEDAEDITQEVFIKVYHGLRKFEQQASFSTWIYRIATNTALDSLDKMERRPKIHFRLFSSKSNSHETEQNEPDLRAASETEPEEVAQQSELRDCIRHVLRKLDREQARLLLLRDFDDRSYEEIAKLLEAGLSAVKMRIHRARLAFQHLFGQICGSLNLSYSASGNGSRERAETKEE
jgi:RNA polymerase sigma-70 factor, ECF subfamily